MSFSRSSRTLKVRSTRYLNLLDKMDKKGFERMISSMKLALNPKETELVYNQLLSKGFFRDKDITELKTGKAIPYINFIGQLQ